MQKLHKDFNNTNILTQKTNTSIKDHFQQLYHEFLTIEEDKEEIVSYLSNTDFYRDKENVLEKLFGELKTAFLSYENVLMEVENYNIFVLNISTIGGEIKKYSELNFTKTTASRLDEIIIEFNSLKNFIDFHKNQVDYQRSLALIKKLIICI